LQKAPTRAPFFAKKVAKGLAEFETFYNLYTVATDNPSKLPKNNSHFLFPILYCSSSVHERKMTGFLSPGNPYHRLLYRG